MPSMTIGQLANEAGVNVETVRFYERRGLVERPPQPTAGYRRYPIETTRRIRFIREAQDLGFSLTEIGQLLSLRVDPRRSCVDVKAAAQAKIAGIEKKIETLRVMRRALVEITKSCSGEGPTSDCPILDALERKASKKGGDKQWRDSKKGNGSAARMTAVGARSK